MSGNADRKLPNVIDTDSSSSEPIQDTIWSAPADPGARGVWDTHWLKLGGTSSRSLFGLASSAARRLIFKPAVCYYLDKYFPSKGLFVETGCGTGESSAGIPRRQRQFLGTDFSMAALDQARETAFFDSLLGADLFQLPLATNSIDGIWNLGVMEHFEYPELRTALDEFWRVLRPGGVLVLFWPAERNFSRWVLAPLEWARSIFTGKSFRFFPDEVTRLRSRRQARGILSEAGFGNLRVDFSFRTAFIHMVLVGRKAAVTSSRFRSQSERDEPIAE